jgi:cbb3-type cytochrome oxidase maturation protein
MPTPIKSTLFCTMEIIYLMMIVSLVLALFFLVSFLWAIKSGQYEDDYTPSVRILFEDEAINNNKNQKANGNRKV